MSHTSQRRGLDPSRPGQELIVLAMIPSAYRDMDGIGSALAELGLKMLEYGPDNWISRNFTEIRLPQLGDPSELMARIGGEGRDKAYATLMTLVGHMSPVITAVYSDVGRVERLIRDIKGDWLAKNREKGYPISVVLSGLTGDAHQCCQNTGVKEHTYLHSLGFFGRVQELPSEEELALITMCGHGLIAVKRVRSLVRSVLEGELTTEEAADDLARPCVCGIVNRKRASGILQRLVQKRHDAARI